ncbi:MAG: ComEC/Rec2 family competence protein [Anaerolineae bacterium]|nr:ComEC/Rec2 family competence protein [Anaerolineae bacterium]
MILVFLAAAWLTGIALVEALAIPWQVLLLIALGGIVAALNWRDSSRARLAGACAVVLALGGGRFLLAQPRFDAHALAAYNDAGAVTVVGVVAEEPDVRESHVNLRVQAERLTLPDGRELDVDGVVLVRAARYPAFDYGDRLRVTGPLETPPHGDDFSYRDYLARQGVYSFMPDVRIRLVESGAGSLFTAALLAFKRHAQSTIAAILHEPAASLLTGILLGIESTIPADLMAAFSATGTTHIIAISGFNITIIAGIFAGLSLRLVGKRYATWVAIAGVIVYTVFVGASAAVVRAAAMGTLYLLGKHLGRSTFAPVSVAASAIFMTLLNPNTLWDMGFQLSFGATVGLILYTDPLERLATRLLERQIGPVQAERVVGWLSEALLVTTAAQIATLPLMIAAFGQLSLVTLLTNVLILPVQSALMISGGIATLTGMVWLPAGKVLGWIAWLPLIYTIEMVRLTARVPFASVSLGHVEVWMAWLAYGTIGLLTWWGYQPGERRAELRARAREAWSGLAARVSDRARLGAAAFLLLFTAIAWRALPDGRLHVTFLDVGHGDAVFIETPAGRQVLVDGAPSSSVLLDRLGRRMPFWDHTIDVVLLSHPDDDLLPGLLPVLERYDVARVVAREMPCYSDVCAEWEAVLAASGAEVLRGEAGLRLWLDESLLLSVLHPGPDLFADSGAARNDNGLVVRLDYGSVCFLLTGDVGEGVEAALVESGAWLDCTVLKAAHHGDAGSTTAGFLAAVSPEVVVIPVGPDDRLRRPHWELLERVERLPVYRTDEDGWVEVVSDGEGYWIETER